MIVIDIRYMQFAKIWTKQEQLGEIVRIAVKKNELGYMSDQAAT